MGLAAAILASHASAGGDSSDGHTHAVQTPVVLAPVSSEAPRLSSQTEQFELVGVLQGKVLTLYLDQFDTNTPVAKAQIELESGAWKGTATEVAPAVYTVSAEMLVQPGKYPLAITVQAGNSTDLMDATLEVAPVAVANADASRTAIGRNWTALAGAIALLLAAITLVFIRRKRSSV
jgi:cobalt-zinc-cadmium efflux system membrane fusion protein